MPKRSVVAHRTRFPPQSSIHRLGKKRRGANAPRTADELFARSDRFRATWEQVTRLVSRVREGESLHHALKEAGVSRLTAIRLAGSALRKKPNGQYAAAPHDRLLRVLVVPDEHGMREIAVKDSREARKVSQYLNALRQQQHTGDASGLHAFARMRITDASGKRVRLLTDVPSLNRLANAGVLSFETIYARTA